MWLLREKLSDFGVKQILHRVDIALYVHQKNSRSHLRAIMVLHHSRYTPASRGYIFGLICFPRRKCRYTPASRGYIFGVENKSDRIFCIRKVYFTNSCQEIWVHAFYTPHLRRKSTMRRCCYHTDLYKMQYFTIFQDKLR